MTRAPLQKINQGNRRVRQSKKNAEAQSRENLRTCPGIFPGASRAEAREEC